MKTVTKQPAEVQDYDVDFEQYFAEFSAVDQIVASSGDGTTTVTITEGDGALVLGPGSLNDFSILPGRTKGLAGQLIKVWVGAGTAGTTYKITVRAVTQAGRQREVDFKARVRAE
jgi:hypothetical protein